MRGRGFLVTLVAAVLLLSSAVAASGKPVKPPKPPKPTTTTQAAPDFWTCQARVDNGATWSLGEWDGAAYVAGISSCTDVLAQHLGVGDWTVAWNGTTVKGTVKGLKLIFEEEIHDNVFAEQVFTTGTGFWCPSLVGDVENLVFVAMPHNADKWLSFEVTMTPGHITEVCKPPM